MTHELKTWPKYWIRVAEGSKTFEVRKNDRDYQIGDFLKLREWNPDTSEYTGNELGVKVTYILNGGEFGIETGHCVMSIKIVSV